MKRKILLLLLCIILPSVAILAGCQDARSKITFYYSDGTLCEEILVNNGTKPSEVDYKNTIDYMSEAYTFKGWYSFESFKNNQPQSLAQYDIAHDNRDIEDDSENNYVAVMSIKEDGWIYEGDPNANAFVWNNYVYASPALDVKAGVNYIRFDKLVNDEALKYCSIWEQGEVDDCSYIESFEIFDCNGFKLNDINTSVKFWENREQSETAITSYILKIVVTVDCEVGIMIGSDIS